jgi:hypothetical protein
MIKKVIKAMKNIFIPLIRYKNFENKNTEIPKYFDKLSEGDFPNKTLNTICYGVGVEKSLVMNDYVGVPAPKVLEDDPWFGPAPISDANLDYMKQETLIKQQEYQETHSVESGDIHQKMYEIATKTWNTLDKTNQFMGGSENIENNNG